MEEGMESYIGLKFPASDVPKASQASLSEKSLSHYFLIGRTKKVSLIPELNPVTRQLAKAFPPKTEPSNTYIMPNA
jgi:light-regulated signal transduction histidine kinase (bacteriophytochrome)